MPSSTPGTNDSAVSFQVSKRACPKAGPWSARSLATSPIGSGQRRRRGDGRAAGALADGDRPELGPRAVGLDLFQERVHEGHAVRALGQADAVRVLRAERGTRELRVAGAEAQGVEQQRVVGHVGGHAALAQRIQGFLVRLELLHGALGRELREDRGPRGARLRGDLLSAQVVVGLDGLVVRLDQYPGLRGVVRPGEGDFLGARGRDGIGGDDRVHLAVDQHLLARGRVHLRELDLGGVAQDVAREELGDARIEAAQPAILLVQQREQVGRLGAAQAQRAGLLDLAGPGARGDGLGAGDGALRHQRVERRGIDGRALGECRAAAGDRQRCDGGFQEGFDRHRHAVLSDGGLLQSMYSTRDVPPPGCRRRTARWRLSAGGDERLVMVRQAHQHQVLAADDAGGVAAALGSTGIGGQAGDAFLLPHQLFLARKLEAVGAEDAAAPSFGRIGERQIDVVLAGACPVEVPVQRIAARGDRVVLPHGGARMRTGESPALRRGAGDDVAPLERQHAARLRKAGVVADEQAQAAQRRVVHRPALAGRGPGAVLLRQVQLAIDADAPFGPGQHRAVVEAVAIALGKARHQVEAEPHRDVHDRRHRLAVGRHGAPGGVVQPREGPLGKHDQFRPVAPPGLIGPVRDGGQVVAGLRLRRELRDRDHRPPARRQRAVPIEAEEIRRVPQEGVGHQRGVVLRPALRHHRLAQELAGAAAGRVDPRIADAVAVIDHGQDLAVGRDHAAAAAELHGALQAPAVALDQVAAILGGAGDPVGRRRALGQPVADVADDIGATQRLQPRGLDEMDVHADQQGDAAQRRFEHRVAQVAGSGPLRLGDVRMALAVYADDAAGADQHRAVVVEIRGRIHLGHADDDVAIARAGQRGEAFRRGARYRLDHRRDLVAVVPAVAGGAHLGRDDQARAGRGGFVHQGEQGLHIAFLGIQDRFELDGGGGKG